MTSSPTEERRETAQHLRGAARTLRYVARQGQKQEQAAIDEETYAAALRLTVDLYELAEEIERAHGPHRVRQLITRAGRRLTDAERTIAEIECVIDTGSEPFATARCPGCEQILAIPRTENGPGVDCKLCRSEWTRQEVFLQ